MSPATRRPSALLAASVAAAVAVPVLALSAASSAAPTTPSGAPALRGVTAQVAAWRAAAPARVQVGQSVRGRQIVARRRGAATAPYVVLVLGQMHGSEPRGRAVVRALRRLAVPGQLQVWSVDTMNPDGARLGTRRNARKVDLNRNFPDRWRRTATNPIYNPGPRPASEPETRAFMTLVDRLRPDLIVSFHQAFRSVDVGNPKTRTWSRRLAQAFHLPMTVVPCRGPCAGTMIGWYNRGYAGYAVTVELPSRVSDRRAASYARATMRVARMLVTDHAVSPEPTPGPTSSGSPTPTSTPTPTNTPKPAAGAREGAGH